MAVPLELVRANVCTLAVVEAIRAPPSLLEVRRSLKAWANKAARFNGK